MTIKRSDESERHQELLGALIRAIESSRNSLVELAHSYKACVDDGMDVSKYIDARFGLKLECIANSKLLERQAQRLLPTQDAMVAALSSLPSDVQQQIVEQGIEIWRDGAAHTVSIEEVRNREARRLIDSTGGRARLLTAKEQAERLTPIVPRHDKIVELRFAPAEYVKIAYAAQKAGQSVKRYLKVQLYLTGIVDGKAQ